MNSRKLQLGAMLVDRSVQVCLMILTPLFGLGCSTLRVTDPVRTATEQFLLSESAVEAVGPLSFETLNGRVVYLEDAYFAPAEKEFVLGELRARLLLAGARIIKDPNKAQIILEVRSGGVGIDRYESLTGIPSILAPASAGAGTPGATLITPELAITKKIRQVGIASVAYVAYWADTGEVVASSGPHIGRAYREDWWFLGFGPHSVGTIPTVDHGFK